ncbi:MAG TPA: HesA/MoeB/ThiF family protein [Bacillota bacterium]|nr:HesA/MoeB/ThiF family protein [Bacillota bacterium]
MEVQLPPRYQRNYRTISVEEQARLRQSTVAVVGCGGLGGNIIEEFARLGVGNLILIDGDRFDATNLNRQLLSTENNLGQSKVEAARQRVEAVNSGVQLSVFEDWFDEAKGDRLLQGADLVMDALDTLPLRVTLERVCHRLNLPLVYAGVAGWYGLLGVSLPGDNVVARLFRGGERGAEKLTGNPAFAPAIIASLAVVEGVKVLIGRDLPLHRAWLHVDLLEMEFQRFELL